MNEGLNQRLKDRRLEESRKEQKGSNKKLQERVMGRQINTTFRQKDREKVWQYIHYSLLFSFPILKILTKNSLFFQTVKEPFFIPWFHVAIQEIILSLSAC
ncbi:hypothetical protein GOODEAATRI_023328 [Goodea atripinnis]|uniref:Uncharacterized protein n=1 Tax=Goodea atripinnis TaxID=208336 RepID=A0ABV0NX20_9TELE